MRTVEDCFRNDLLVDRDKGSSISTYVSLRVEGRLVLSVSLLHPVRKSLCSHRSIIVFGAASLPNHVGKLCRTYLIHLQADSFPKYRSSSEIENYIMKL